MLDFCTGKNRATTLEGVGGVENVPDEGGPRPFLGRGVLREGFSSLFFFHPLHAVL